MLDWAAEYERISGMIRKAGVEVRAESLGPGILGAFDGVSITTSPDWDYESRCHSLAHCLGHTIQWSVDYELHETMYRDLAAAKREKESNPEFLARMLEEFRRYEEEASEFGASLFEGRAEASSAFAVFARADIEAILAFHREGVAPPWKPFFDKWKAEVAGGERVVAGFSARRIPALTLRRAPVQEVIQQATSESGVNERFKTTPPIGRG